MVFNIPTDALVDGVSIRRNRQAANNKLIGLLANNQFPTYSDINSFDSPNTELNLSAIESNLVSK